MSRVLVLGSGGREHALARALARSKSVTSVIVAPGNGGCSSIIDGTAISQKAVDVTQPAEVVQLAKAESVDLVVVGPEAPLCAGVVDALEDAGITAFGPSKAAARLEGSKAFMKQFCTRHGIPTAPYLVTSDIDEAERYIDAQSTALVVKADGLAAGKGAIVTSSAEEAKDAARGMLVEGRFGDAGKTIVIEERLPGYELSVHALCDGERYVILPVSRDHKRVDDGDQGPNTGGMGAFAPVAVDPALMLRIEESAIQPTLEGMQKEGSAYRGVLYAGLMIAPDGSPVLLEHNVRFGDPETQVLLPLLDTDVGELLTRASTGALTEADQRLEPSQAAVAVVLAAGGYPTNPKKGDTIHGLSEAEKVDGVSVYHAGTRQQDDQLLTSGGRVAAVGAVASTVNEAKARAYRAIEHICFADMHFRTDIANSHTD